MKHPIQSIELDKNGDARFKENKIVRYLLDNGRIDLNKLACIDFSQEDREQFAQLIGYSLFRYGELSYVRNETYESACRMFEFGKTEAEAKIEIFEEIVKKTRLNLKEIVPIFFQIHPDDLHD